MAVALVADARLAREIEERRVHAVEHAIVHPIRGSIVSVTSQSLQELNPRYGATMGEAVFDLALLGDRSGVRQLEHLVPVGAHFVAAIFQSRCLVVWDLRDAVLYSVTEVEKQQKSVAALAASLCRDRWLFYASEGSNSIKVSAVDARDPPKKISRKAANRSSQLTALAYHTPRRVLGAGASDGSFQLWTFSEENSLGSGTKEEAAVVAPLFTAQSTQSPVVQMTFAACGQSPHLLLIGYQNRVVEVWDLAPNPATRHREPYRVAILHCLPPQAMDFAKKNGELSLQMHGQAPLLVVHWHAYNGAGSSVADAEIRLIGGSSSPTPVTLSDWQELIPSGPPSHEDGSAVLVFATNAPMPTSPFAAYTSTQHHRHILPLAVTSALVSSSAEANISLTLSSRFQLNLDQYFNYQDVPSSVLQVSRNAEASTPQSIAFQLQRYSQTTGEVEKLEDLPVWTNYQGRQLLPWKLRWNERQTAVCIQLIDPVKALNTTDEDAGFTYVMLEVNTKTKPHGDMDGDSVGATSSVTCGSPMEALDTCFCDPHHNSNRSYVMLVLASTGKSIGFQTNCDLVDQNSTILLQQPIQRIFSSPIRLSTNSPHASMVGTRLIYVFSNSIDHNSEKGPQQIVLSEDDLSVPCQASTGFKTRSSQERILDVVWNAGAATTEQTSLDGLKHLAAVRMTERVIILSISGATPSLSVVAEYDLHQDLGSPQSLLWMAQTLLFVTSDRHVRFVTPLVKPKPEDNGSQLLCSLPVDASMQQKVDLISACGDRLCFSLQDPNSLECKSYLRPMAVSEPLLVGFAEPSDGRLKAIFERDFLIFLSTGGQETRNPVTDRLLDVLYHDFGWTDTVARVLDALVNPSSAGASASGGSGGAGSGSSGSSSYKKFSHLSPAHISSLMLHTHKWRDAMRVYLANDPALEEYALTEDEVGSSSAKLPSRTGATAIQFRWLAKVLGSIGQADLAIKCLDLAGDDLGLLELLLTHAVDRKSTGGILNALQKDWAKLNPPLAAITKACSGSQSDSTIHRRHDLFSLLCCERLEQTERRSRLLASVRPLDKYTMKTTTPEPEKPPAASSARASILYWKRLAPEDAKDAIGTSTTPHFSTDEPKNPSSYALFHASSGSSIGIGSGSSGKDPQDGSAIGNSTSSNEVAAKMTIGPFLEDEDAVVAYWRFEEGSTASDDDTKRTLESSDTTKRENHLQILQFGPVMSLVTATAPVDKGEEGKLQEAFSLRFPARDVAPSDEWGAMCAVRPGSTLDIGLVFDEDPYRRRFTLEAWVRNFVLARKQQQAQEEGDDFSSGDDGGIGASALSDDTTLRRLVSRRGVDKSIWWEFGLCDGGFLYLTFGEHTLKAEEKVSNAAAWQHVAFSVDITSPKHAVLKLFLQARCVASKEIHNVDANAKLLAQATKALAGMAPGEVGLPPPPSTVHLGLELTDYEMTEVRAWANARTAEQLSDMKENYLGIAETKRRMKIAIHQRNCQCEKCLGRRTKPQAGNKAALLAAPLFPSTPPSGSARDRRRPQPKA